VADEAIKFAEIAEIRCEAVADFAQDWHIDHHPKWGNAGGRAREDA
jgi:hypothetical protein